jgi:hypothetical protein
MSERRDGALGNDHVILRHVMPQGNARFEIHRKGVQVPVVDAYDLGTGGDGPFQGRQIVGLHETVQAQVGSPGQKARQGVIVEDIRDEKHGIGAQKARLVDLVGIDDKIFPQDREGADAADDREVLPAATKKDPIRQDGDGAAPFCS